VVLGAGGWFTWKALRPAKPKPPTGAQPAKKTGAVEIAKGAAAQGTGAVAKVTGAVQSNLTSVARANPPGSATGAPPAQLAGGPGTNAEPAVAATGNPPVPALWPKLDLQGIFFRLQNPSARINGTNLYVGNEIEGARVVDIQRLSVLVQLGAETNVLTLGQ